MISAELKYRTYVPWGYIAIEYASLTFNGNLDKMRILKDLIDLIEYEKYSINKPKIKYLKEKIEINNKKVKNLIAKVEAIKKKHKLLFLNKEANLLVKEIEREKDRLYIDRNNLSAQLKKLEDDRFFDAYELKHKFKDLLAKLDFSCKSSHKIGDTANGEIYEFSGDEQQLMAKAKNMYNRLKENLDKKIQSSLKEFQLVNENIK